MPDIEAAQRDEPRPGGSRLRQTIGVLFGAVLLLLMLGNTGLAINELLNRSTLFVRIDSSITEIARRIAAMPDNFNANVPSTAAGQNNSPTLLPAQLKSRLGALYRAKEVMRNIEATGADPETSPPQTKQYVQNLILDIYETPEEVLGIPKQENSYVPYYTFLQRYDIYSGLSSEMLLGMTVVFCGGIGAIISALRNLVFQSDVKQAPNAGYSIHAILGISSGFVVYIAIRGGKHIFIWNDASSGFSLNPWGCAFAALLTGLFTERAHKMLSRLMDGLEKYLGNSGSG
jgi:hypothetical protein